MGRARGATDQGGRYCLRSSAVSLRAERSEAGEAARVFEEAGAFGLPSESEAFPFMAGEALKGGEAA